MSKVPIKYMIYTSVGFGARVYKDEQEKKKKNGFCRLVLFKLASTFSYPPIRKWKKQTSRLNVIARANFQIASLFIFLNLAQLFFPAGSKAVGPTIGSAFPHFLEVNTWNLPPKMS